MMALTYGEFATICILCISGGIAVGMFIASIEITPR